MKYNFHSHTQFSDGKHTMQELLDIVKESGFEIFGISDHSPVPFPSDWNMKFEDFYSYLSTIELFRMKKIENLELYFGLEADYFEDKNFITFWRQFDFDYIIGGVHYFTEKLDGVPFNLDASMELFTLGLNRVFGCNIEEMVFTYYDLVLKMITQDKPDIIAHLNLIEKFNHSDRFFNPNEKWYFDKVLEVLQAIKKENLIIEVNSRSKYKGYVEDFMPSMWILKEAKKLDIPVMIAGDIHSHEDVNKFWEDSVKALKEVGYEKTLILKDKKWQFVKI